MTMENDLVERLRARRESVWDGRSQDHHWVDDADCIAAAKRIQALEAELARKTEALKPFVEAADSLDANDDYSSASIWEHPCALDITIGDLRRARRAARSALEEKTDV